MQIEPGKYYEILDTAKAGGRVTELEAEQMVNNYNPAVHAAAATLGHVSDYAKRSSRVPAGAWVESLKKVGTKILASFEFPGKVTVPVPPEFKELVGMGEFFQEAIKKGLWKKRSVGVMNTPNGAYLHHVAFLGAKAPECKGMSDAELAENPQLKNLVFEFSENLEINEIESEMATTKELADYTPEQLTAIDTLLAAIGTMLGIENGTPEELLGAAKAKLAEAEKAKTEAAAIANAGMSAPAVGSPFEMSEAGKKLFATVGNLEKIVTEMAKAKELADATPPADAGTTPPAGTDAATAPAGIESLGLSPADAQAKADAVKADLDSKKIWLPAFDTDLLPIMPLLANVKVDGGSALDKIATALSSLPGLVQLSAVRDMFRVEELTEKPKDNGGITIALEHGMETTGNEEFQKVKEFAEKHNITGADWYVKAIEQMPQA